MNKKKVLWITSTFPLEDGDIEVPWMVQLVKSLNNYFQVDVLAPTYRGKGEREVDGIRVHRWRYAPSFIEDLTYGTGMPTKIKNPMRWPVFLSYLFFGRQKVRSLLKNENYDLIFINWPIPHIYLVPDLQVPIISKYYTAELVYAKWFKFLLKKILDNSELIFISNYAKDTHDDLLGIISYEEVIPEIPFIKPSIPVKHEGFNILFVGRLIPRKGVDYLINAVLSMKEEVQLDIVGTGKNKFRGIIEAVKDVGITFHGRIPDDKLKDLYAKADVLVLPAIVDKNGDTEGLGMVLIEAIQSGVPVIASNVGGIPDIVIHEKTGLLVEQKDIEGLKEAILRIKNEKGLADKLKAEAKKHIDKNFNSKVIIQKYKKLFEEVTA